MVYLRTWCIRACGYFSVRVAKATAEAVLSFNLSLSRPYNLAHGGHLRTLKSCGYRENLLKAFRYHLPVILRYRFYSFTTELYSKVFISQQISYAARKVARLVCKRNVLVGMNVSPSAPMRVETTALPMAIAS